MMGNLKEEIRKLKDVPKSLPDEAVILIGIPLTKERFDREKDEKGRDFVKGLLKQWRYKLDRDFLEGRLKLAVYRQRLISANLAQEAWEDYNAKVVKPIRQLIGAARRLSGKEGVIEDAGFEDFQRTVASQCKIILILGHNVDPQGSNSIEMADRIWSISEITDALRFLDRPLFFDITCCKGEVLAKVVKSNQYVTIVAERPCRFPPVPSMYLFVKFLSLLNGRVQADVAYVKAIRMYLNEHLRRAK